VNPYDLGKTGSIENPFTGVVVVGDDKYGNPARLPRGEDTIILVYVPVGKTFTPFLNMNWIE
jgi:hypothetical protein